MSMFDESPFIIYYYISTKNVGLGVYYDIRNYVSIFNK